ncbi:MAG: exosome complex exonuclease Rrp41 [Candidatus Micrarchaeota archaeon]
MASSTPTKQLIINGKRLDGRTAEDIRPLKIQAGVLKNADGSALVEWGLNKVIVGVYGPRECIPRHQANPFKAIIKVKYAMTPFASKEEHGRAGPSRRSTEISKVIREVFEQIIDVSRFPKTQIEVYIEILQAHGGTRVTAINAAAVALANAGIPMRDMACAIAGGKAEGQIILDLAKDEDNFGQSDTAISLSHRDKEILLLQMDGLLTKEEIIQIVEMAERASDKIHEEQTKGLVNFYEDKGKTEW